MNYLGFRAAGVEETTLWNPGDLNPSPDGEHTEGPHPWNPYTPSHYGRRPVDHLTDQETRAALTF